MTTVSTFHVATPHFIALVQCVSSPVDLVGMGLISVTVSPTTFEKSDAPHIPTLLFSVSAPEMVDMLDCSDKPRVVRRILYLNFHTQHSTLAVLEPTDSFPKRTFITSVYRPSGYPLHSDRWRNSEHNILYQLGIPLSGWNQCIVSRFLVKVLKKIYGDLLTQGILNSEVSIISVYSILNKVTATVATRIGTFVLGRHKKWSDHYGHVEKVGVRQGGVPEQHLAPGSPKTLVLLLNCNTRTKWTRSTLQWSEKVNSTSCSKLLPRRKRKISKRWMRMRIGSLMRYAICGIN